MKHLIFATIILWAILIHSVSAYYDDWQINQAIQRQQQSIEQLEQINRHSNYDDANRYEQREAQENAERALWLMRNAQNERLQDEINYD